MARPPRDLNSKFLATQERKIQTREEDKVAKAKEEELAKIAVSINEVLPNAITFWQDEWWCRSTTAFM